MAAEKTAVIIISSLLVIGLSAVIISGQEPVEKTVIFILDDFSSETSLAAGGQVSHGEIVKKVISTEAPEVPIICYSVAGKAGKIQRSRYLAGLRWVLSYAAKHPSRQIIVNISLSFFSEESLHHRLIKRLVNRGVEIVAAAGNDDSKHPVYPAGYPEVIAVANADRQGKLANSNYGVYIDLAAPGDASYISRAYYPAGIGITRLRAAGTSFSVPRVVGLLAKLVSKKQDLTLQTAEKVITATARPIESALYQRGNLGAGMIAESRAIGRVLPKYQLHHQLVLWAINSGLLLLVSGLIVKYRWAGIFFALLVLLIGFPLVMLVARQAKVGLESVLNWAAKQKIGIRELVSVLGSMGTALLVTTWERAKLTASYLVLLVSGLIFIIYSSVFAAVAWLFWSWTAVVVSLEWSLVGYVRWFAGPQTAIKLSGCPSWRVVARIESKLKTQSFSEQLDYERILQQGSPAQQIMIIKVLAEQGTDRAQTLIQQQMGAFPASVEIKALKGLVKFSPAPVRMVVGFAVKHNLSADQLVEWWPQMSTSEITELLELTQAESELKTKLAVEFIGQLTAELIVDQIRKRLRGQDTEDKESLLKALIQLGSEAEAALPEVVNIIRTADRVWLRYKGLRALQAIAPNVGEFRDLLQNLQTEEAELVRLEAAGIINELATNCQ